MKKIIQLLIFILLICSSAFAQEKKDSTKKENKKQYFIGLQLGGGVGWRKYGDVGNTPVIFIPRSPHKGEKPGLAYNCNINVGVIKKRWNYSLGLEYNYVSFYNKHAVDTIRGIYDTLILNYKYSFIHQFLSVSMNVDYCFGKNKSWYIGGVLKFSWLIKYSRLINNTPVDFTSSYPVLWSGITFGKRIIETKKLNFNIGCGINYSSVVGGNTVEVGVSTGLVSPPSYISKFESTPRNLLVPSLQFSLQYKL